LNEQGEKDGELRRRENSTIRKDDWNRDERAIKIFPQRCSGRGTPGTFLCDILYFIN
jgi:hypothetical protein